MTVERLTDDEVDDFKNAVENAHRLARETAEALGELSDPPQLMFTEVEIVLGNPTVKEYKIKIGPA